MSYCHDCGKKLPVATASFCCFCGVSLASLSNKPAPPPPPTQRPQKSFAPYVPNEDDDEDGDSKYDHMSQLDIRIDRLEVDLGPTVAPRETVGELFNAGARFGPGAVEQRDAPKMSKKQFRAEWAKEAGQLRRED